MESKIWDGLQNELNLIFHYLPLEELWRFGKQIAGPKNIENGLVVCVTVLSKIVQSSFAAGGKRPYPQETCDVSWSGNTLLT